jgi:DNA-binding transcriptional LysR family regulator
LRTREPKTPGLRRLRLGVLPTVPSWVSASLVRELQRIDPEVPVFAQEASLADLRKRLFEGRFDICLTSLRPLEKPFRQHRLFADRIVLAFAADDPDGRKRRITPEVLRDKPLVARTQCEHLFHASRIMDSLHVQPRIVLRTSDDAHALDFVAHGAASCLVPDSLRWPGVVLKPVEGIDLPRTIGLEWVGGRMDDWVKPKLAALHAAAQSGKRPR